MRDQPGLEVVVPRADLEVASQSYSTSQNHYAYSDISPEVVPIELLHRQSHRPEAIYAFGSEKELINNPSGVRGHGLANLTEKSFNVVGSRRSDSVSSTAALGTPTSSSSSSPISGVTSSRPIQSNSGLAVAGWRTQNEFFNFRVFYQDQDDALRFSEYQSDGAGWGNSTKVNREDVMLNTTLGATIILENNPPQYELFFQNTSSLVPHCGETSPWTSSHLKEPLEIGGSYKSSFSAFTVAREKDLNNGTNMYILYQTESNDLDYVYSKGDSWELGSSSDVLKNADPSTDITFLTESIWDGKAVMSSTYDMSRCYFYSRGQIKQVKFNGSLWTEAENIPYP
ncbi:hypothetical protein F5B22DRAFT_645293 [Xylaria bambusicola]|uniref:uncharacterized protein n=1 Tax=Xylaria bambusicola TaxID=326684 RepID=UPI0020072990|nr:uncharacterized protein F5B22DRAFT_645293 [Xylaria bambusicola]KAI0518044.1 hypothetical protein F5B22DRAFT_645293 [Xylaria bambusicola]